MIKKIGLGIAAVAAVSFAMMSTSAIANTAHHTSKNVKCYGVDSKGNKTNGHTMVSSKSACEKLGGTTQKPSSDASSSSSATPSNTNTNMNNMTTQPSTGAQPTTTTPNQ